MKEKIDLVGLSKVESKISFTSNGDGTYTPDYQRITIMISNDDGSKKYINIRRQNGLYLTGINHVIETYTLRGEGMYQNEYNRKYKMYDMEKFESRLKKIEKELSKVNYKIT